jgi:quercetin dioxygenase-like cupin family protein
VRSWNLNAVEVSGGTRSPVVLRSDDGAARAVLIAFDPGDELGDHQVKEHAFVVVVDGNVRVESGDEAFDGGVGTVVNFEPDERHSLSSESGARVLLLLAPWPGEGHFRGEERAADRATP